MTTGPASDRDRDRFDPRTSVRIASAASEKSDVFRNADGSFTRKVHQAPVNFKAADGSWTPIDTTLDRGGDGRWRVKASGVGVDFAGSADGPALAAVHGDARHSVSYRLKGAAAVPGSVSGSGSTVTYPKVLAGTDLVLTSQFDGVKESIVLASAQVATSWVFPLDLQGVAARLAGDGSVEFVDEAGVVAAKVPHGYMTDSKHDPRSGETARSSAVTYELVTDGGVPALKVSVDAGWLADPARVFPVTVDPTVVGAQLWPNNSTYVQSRYPGTDHEYEWELKTGTYDGVDLARSFLKFDNFATTFNGAQITAATLNIFDLWAYTCTPKPFNVYAISGGWNPATTTSWPGPALGAWMGSTTAAPGPACLNSNMDWYTGAWMYVPLDPTTFNQWAAGTAANNGLAVVASTTDVTQWKRFASARHAWAPTLTITYTTAQIVAQYPPTNYAATTLTPELMATSTSTTVRYQFAIYDTKTGGQVGNSGLLASGDWVVPAGTLSWGQNYFWLVQTFDGYNYSDWQPTVRYVSTPPPQPPVTSHLAQNPSGRGFEPSVGNYTTSVTDAQIASVGPALSVDRSYNSLDPRLSTAFGAGWSTVLDAKVVERYNTPGVAASGVAAAVITYPSGQEVAFGRNNDGTFSPPQGRFATFKAVTGGYTLTDKDSTVYTFTAGAVPSYALTSVTDASGRTLTLTYASGRVVTVTSASGRALHFTWTTPVAPYSAHVSTVYTDQATAGDATSVSTWTYSYSGDQLTKVCPPTSSTACTTYGYATSSQHASVVQDAGPASYWRFNEASGTTAASSVLANAGSDNGVYANVTLGQPAALPGSTATSAGFNGTSSSVLLPPSVGLILGSSYQTISMWFKTTSSNGVLYSYQSSPIGNGTTASGYVPALYVGNDGHLLGAFWTGGAAPIVSPGAVTDGAWHHVVLTGAGNTQTMYLDNVAVGSKSGQIAVWPGAGVVNNYIGAGFIGYTWPDQAHYSTTNTTGYATYFNGSISDVAFYNKPVDAATVAGHYTAGRNTAKPLASVTKPSGKTYAQVSYDTVTGTVKQVTDANGGVWKIAAPTASGSSQVYASTVLGTGPSNYWRLGETTSTVPVNQVHGGTAAYSAVTLGVPGAFGAGDDTAGSFNGASSSMNLPTGMVSGSNPFTVELWFNAAAGKNGVLYSEMNSGTVHYVPMLYIGVDGRLRGEQWIGSVSPVTTAGRVDDGQWHHAVLAGGGAAQSLYLDGAKVGDLAGAIDHLDMTLAVVGTGNTSGWAQGNGAWFPFAGSIDEVAVYNKALTPADVSAHYAAFKSSSGIAPLSTVAVTDPGNKTISYGYDPLHGNRLLTVTDALANKTRYGYDTSGYLNTVTDPNGNVTTTGHDVRGNTVSQTSCQNLAANTCSTVYTTYYPDSTTTNLTPDPRNDQPLTVRDARSASATDNTYLTSLAYDTAGNRTGATTPPVAGFPSGRTTTTTYTTASTPAVDSGFTPAGLPATITSPGGTVQTFTYLHNGDLAQSTDAAGLVTAFTYDGLGRALTKKVISDTYPAGLTTTLTYTKGSQVATATDPPVTNRVTGAVHTAKASMVYDADGNVTSLTGADLTGGDASRTVTTSYDTHGLVASTTDPAGKTTAFGYDAYGNRTKVVDPAGKEVDSAFDANGHLLTTTLKAYTGDPVNPSPAADLVLESRSYDPAGRLAAVFDPMGREDDYYYTDNGLLLGAGRSGVNGEWFTTQWNSYDAAGHLLSRDVNGTTDTAFGYDPAGRKTTMWQGSGPRTTTYTYSPDDALLTTAKTDPTGATETIDATYDPLGRQKSSTVHNGASLLTTTWALDKRGLATSKTDQLGNVTTYAYDEAGKLALTSLPTVNTEIGGGTPVATHPVSTIGYNTFGETTETSNPLGNVVTTGYDAAGRPVSQKLPSYTPPGSATPIVPIASKTYNSVGQVITDTDPLGHNTTYTYDQLGDLATVTGANLGVTHVTYDTNREALSATDPTGAQTQATYDYRGRKKTITQVVRQPSAAAYTTTYAYNDVSGSGAGWLASTTSPAGVVTSYNHNELGEVTAVTDGAGNTTSYTLDLDGRTIATTLPDGTKQTTVYDPAGRPTTTKELDAAGTVLATRSVGYDNASHVVSATDAKGTTATFGYDATGLLTSQVQPVTTSTSITTSFGYDAAGNRTRFTDGRGNKFISTYNRWSLPETQVEPSTTAYPNPADRTFTTVYDAAGEITSRTAPGGVTVANTYNTMGDLTGQTGTGAEATTTARSFGYDTAGRMTSASAPGGTDTFSYDDRGLLLTAAGPSGASSFGYTPDGLMASRTDAAGTATYSYTAGRLSTMVDPATGTTLSYTYNTLNQPVTATYGTGGDVRSFGYDTRHRITTDTLKTAAGATVASIAYGYDLNNDLTSKTTTGFTGSTANTYTYDLARRLTSWNNGSATANYTYDASGNRTQAGTKTFVYNERNQVTTGGGSTYSYTARGTLASTITGSTTITSTSDAFDQAKTQGTQTYTYDALARVVTATTSGGPTLTLAYSGTGNLGAADGTAKYSRDPDGGLIGVNTTTGNRLLLTDQHTDVVGQFLSTGTTLTGSTTYDPLGSITATAGTKGNHGYQSGWTDTNTGRVNMAARWYNPATGQFAARDSLDINPTSGSSAGNRYAYTNSNPLLNTDPTGHLQGPLGSVLTAAEEAAEVDAAVVVCATLCSLGVAVVAGAVVGALWDPQSAGSNGCPESGCDSGYEDDRARQIAAAQAEADAENEGWRQYCLQYPWTEECHGNGTPPTDTSNGDNNGNGNGYRAGSGAHRRIPTCNTSCLRRSTRPIRDMPELRQRNLAAPDHLDPNLLGDPKPAQGGDTKPAQPRDTCYFGTKHHIDGTKTIGAWVCGEYLSANDERLIDAVTGAIERLGGTAANRVPADSGGIITGGGPRGKPIRGSNDPPPAPSGPPTKCHSFDPSTPVLMADGTTKPIKDIQVGDQVKTTDPATDATGPHTVVALHLNHDTDLTDLTLQTADGHTETLHTTWHHPVWDQTQQRWVDAAQIPPGDQLRTLDGTTDTVTAVHNFIGNHEMRDLTVDTVHTYYVVAAGIPVLVHNCDHIALGRTEAVQDFADSVGARHVMGQGPGEWQNSIVRGAYDPKTRFSVSLDGVEDVEGSLLRGRYKEAGIPARVGGRTPSWFDWEMHTLNEAGAWDRVTFYHGGEIVPNPFA